MDSPFLNSSDRNFSADRDRQTLVRNLRLLLKESESVSAREVAVLQEFLNFLPPLSDFSMEKRNPEKPVQADELADLLQDFLFPGGKPLFSPPSVSGHSFPREDRSRPSPGIGRNRDQIRCTALLCRILSNRLGKSLRFDCEDFLFRGEQLSAEASERVAYLQNRYSDIAFLRLTSHLSQPRVSYFSSFPDTCEEVYHGLAEYCILPLENTSDGKLMRFYSLIDKFDLKIVAVSDIETAEDGSFTRYALLRNKISSLTPPRLLAETCYAEFSVVPGDDISLSDLLLASELCGLSLQSADSYLLPYKDNGYRYHLVFSVGEYRPDSDQNDSKNPDVSASEELLQEYEAKIKAFLLFLSLSLPEYTPLGFYTRIP